MRSQKTDGYNYNGSIGSSTLSVHSTLFPTVGLPARERFNALPIGPWLRQQIFYDKLHAQE